MVKTLVVKELPDYTQERLATFALNLAQVPELTLVLWNRVPCVFYQQFFPYHEGCLLVLVRFNDVPSLYFLFITCNFKAYSLLYNAVFSKRSLCLKRRFAFYHI